MPVSDPSSDIDWSEIRETFKRISATLRGFELLDETDYERFRLRHLTFGQVSAPEWMKVELGGAICVSAPMAPDMRHALLALAEEVGARKSAGLGVPDYVRARLRCVDHFKVVAEAIRLRSISHHFLTSWARLHALEMQYNFLFASTEISDALVRQGLRGAQAGNLVQLHWYAHWMDRNALSLSRHDRIDPEHALAALCLDIVQGRVAPWKPYPAEWFGRLLSNEEPRDDLSGNVIKLGADRLAKMLLDPLLTPAVLPPLRREEFDRLPPPGGGG